MLNYLSVKNVSVIESLSLELEAGLTVLTGETGSGKSVLVGALKLLLGERFQKTMLREGADKLRVEGIFEGISLPDELKEQYEVEDELVIRREVDAAGKNRIFINGHAATVGQLKDFAPWLADIHGQHEHQALLDESRHLSLIDHMLKPDVLQSYAAAYEEYRRAKTAHKELATKIDDIRKRHDIISFQRAELEAANIDIDADGRLAEEISLLSNIEKICQACADALDKLSEGDISASVLIVGAIKSLSPMGAVSGDVQEVMGLLEGCLESLDTAVKKVESLFSMQEASPEDLDRLIQRKYMLADLMKKYGADLPELVEKLAELTALSESFESSDSELEKLAGKMSATRDKADKEMAKLQDARQKAADEISMRIQEILGELELPDTIFNTVFTKSQEPDVTGGTEAAFYISVNKGFKPAPLAQVASGGEISRVMLALKEVFADVDATPTLLFDEIDTGISGRTAKKVATKLAALAKNKQIIVITHLPVVAAAGNAHFHIEKSSDNGLTKTTVNKLENADRRNTLAAMIAGSATSAAIMQAEELLRWGGNPDVSSL
jgi:DNA repair protein RecN (Recombination protein N)